MLCCCPSYGNIGASLWLRYQPCDKHHATQICHGGFLFLFQLPNVCPTHLNVRFVSEPGNQHSYWDESKSRDSVSCQEHPRFWPPWSSGHTSPLTACTAGCARGERVSMRIYWSCRAACGKIICLFIFLKHSCNAAPLKRDISKWINKCTPGPSHLRRLQQL